MLPNAELRKRLPLALYGRVDLISIDELGYMDLDRRDTVQRPPCCRDPSGPPSRSRRSPQLRKIAMKGKPPARRPP